MNKNLLIVGCGGHGRVVLDTAIKMNIWDNIAFVDDNYPSVNKIDSVKVLSKIKNIHKLIKNWKYVIIAIGDNFVRHKVSKILLKYKFSFVNIIDPSASISKKAKIGKGNVILANSVIAAGSKVNHHSIINHGAVVEHDCKIGSYTHICSNVTMSGNIHIGDNVFIGLGSVIIKEANIGNKVRVGAFSLVNKSITSNKLVYGVPVDIRAN